jgi:hypothetical protein
VLWQHIASHTGAYLLAREATSKPVGKPSSLFDGLSCEVTRRKLKQVRWKNCRCQQKEDRAADKTEVVVPDKCSNLFMCQNMKRLLCLMNVFGTWPLCLATYSEHETLCQGTTISVTYADDNFGCSGNSLVGYYVCSDISEKSVASISRVSDFGSGGCWSDWKDENVLSIGYGASAWVVANQKYGKRCFYF